MTGSISPRQFGTVLSAPEDDSPGERRARLGILLAGLIVLSSPSIATAQIPSVPTPSPVSEVTDTITDTVEGVDDTVDEVKKEVRRQRRRVKGKIDRAIEEVGHKTKAVEGVIAEAEKSTRNVTGNEVQTKTNATGREKSRKQPTHNKNDQKKRAKNVAQEKGSGRGQKNESGDVNRLVDAGDEIEGTVVESAPAEPKTEPRGESLPFTGFDPRTIALGGLSMIVAGTLLLTMRERPHPVASS